MFSGKSDQIRSHSSSNGIGGGEKSSIATNRASATLSPKATLSEGSLGISSSSDPGGKNRPSKLSDVLHSDESSKKYSDERMHKGIGCNTYLQFSLRGDQYPTILCWCLGAPMMDRNALDQNHCLFASS